METFSIRDLRGAALRESASKGEPLAITNHRVLVGVLIPAATGWVEHLISHNWSEVRQSIGEAEEVMTAGQPMVTIDDIVSESDAARHRQQPDPDALAEPVVPLAAAMLGGTVTQGKSSRETVKQLQAALNPLEPSVVHTMRTIRIGNLSAAQIERAGANGEALAVTHDRELIGVLVPVTPDLVQFLIEQNIDRIVHRIKLGEKQLKTSEQLTTLDQVSPPSPASHGGPGSVNPPSGASRR
jgi:hypothetical protein